MQSLQFLRRALRGWILFWGSCFVGFKIKMANSVLKNVLHKNEGHAFRLYIVDLFSRSTEKCFIKMYFQILRNFLKSIDISSNKCVFNKSSYECKCFSKERIVMGSLSHLYAY